MSSNAIIEACLVWGVAHTLNMVGLYNEHHPWEENLLPQSSMSDLLQTSILLWIIVLLQIWLDSAQEGVDANNANTYAKAWHFETVASHVSIDSEGGYSWITFVGSYSQHVDHSHDIIYVNIVGICIVQLTLRIPVVWPTIYVITHEICSVQWWSHLNLQPLTMFPFFSVVSEVSIKKKWRCDLKKT